MLSVRWVFILSIIIGALFWHKYEVKVAVNEYAVTHQLEYAKELTRLTEINIKTKSELENKVKILKDNKDAEIKTINARYDSIITGMQYRPSRQEHKSNSTNNTSNPESTKATTGAGLYKEDANFLAGYARDTERLKVELIQCYKQYDDVQTTVNNFVLKYK
jgi:hypothetical protein